MEFLPIYNCFYFKGSNSLWLTSVIALLKEQISGEVRFDESARVLYIDASIYEMEPVGLVLPRNEQDVINLTLWALDHNVSILPRGGGLQSCRLSVVINPRDFSKYMNQIGELNLNERWIWVQPGVST